jgi:hypothetical protein
LAPSDKSPYTRLIVIKLQSADTLTMWRPCLKSSNETDEFGHFQKPCTVSMEAHAVSVEVHLANGLPAWRALGMPGVDVREIERRRLRSAPKRFDASDVDVPATRRRMKWLSG